jgi:hypothetical protein
MSYYVGEGLPSSEMKISHISQLIGNIYVQNPSSVRRNVIG